MKKVFLIIFLSLFCGALYNQGLNLPAVKKNIVYLGYNDLNGIKIIGTGFIVTVGGYHHLLTSKHAVVKVENGRLTNQLNDIGLIIFIHDKFGNVIGRPISEAKALGMQWIFHNDDNVDIALIPFATNKELDDYTSFGIENFITTEDLYETYEVVFVSYQKNISQRNNLSPIFRTGMISTINIDKTFYIDGDAFPGNSGSPVFLKTSLLRYSKEGKASTNLGSDTLAWKIIGIVSGYEYQSRPAKSDQPMAQNIFFEENTGLTKIWSVDYLNEIIESTKFQEQISKIKKRFGSSK